MHAAIDTLINEAEFPPKVALAVVKSMEIVVAESQLVTIPVLDSWLAEFRAEMATRFAGVDTRFAEVRAETKASFAVLRAEIDIKLAKLKTDLIFWIAAIVLGSDYLPKIVSTVTEAIAAAVRGVQ